MCNAYNLRHRNEARRFYAAVPIGRRPVVRQRCLANGISLDE